MNFYQIGKSRDRDLDLRGANGIYEGANGIELPRNRDAETIPLRAALCIQLS